MGPAQGFPALEKSLVITPPGWDDTFLGPKIMAISPRTTNPMPARSFIEGYLIND
jgi:hypothetical protein